MLETETMMPISRETLFEVTQKIYVKTLILKEKSKMNHETFVYLHNYVFWDMTDRTTDKTDYI